MYTIGEFSKISKLSSKMLRHYDKIGLLKPERIDSNNGYRYYSQEQIESVIFINKYKSYGFSLKEIGELLKVKDKNQLEQNLKERILEVKEGIGKFEKIIREIKEEIEMLSKGEEGALIFEIKHCRLPQMNIVALRERIKVEEVGRLFEGVMMEVGKNRLFPTGALFTRYYDEEFYEDGMDMEVCVPVNRSVEGISYNQKPQNCIITDFEGDYKSIGMAYGALFEYIKKNNLMIVGSFCERYITGPESGVEPSEYLTEIFVPVEKKP